MQFFISTMASSPAFSAKRYLFTFCLLSVLVVSALQSRTSTSFIHSYNSQKHLYTRLLLHSQVDSPGHSVHDAKGQTISVGTVVRVVQENLKAYQVPPKGQGSFNEQREFVPREDGDQRPYLLLPLGLKGIATKVYDENAVSANFPVQVKFEPGKYNDEYDPPVPFSMHFLPEEVEVCNI